MGEFVPRWPELKQREPVTYREARITRRLFGSAPN